MTENISVRPVSNSRQRKLFIKLPWSIYQDDPAWVPPLRLERRLHFSSLNPFFKHGQWRAWLAYSNDRPVGRISAQIDALHRQQYGPDTGHFGLLEGEHEPAIFKALMHTAESWLLEQQARRISGPFNFSINQECGLLVDGFETPPVFMMPHHRPWYGQCLEAQGYLPAKDLFAYRVKVDFERPAVMRRLITRYGRRVRLRTLRRRDMKNEMALLRELFNEAWAENWGFVPFTQAEFAELGTSLRLLVPDDYVQIAELDGQAVAFIVALPNVNEVLPELDGRLFPFGLFKLLRHIKGGRIKTGRVPLMGVRRQYQNRPLGMAMIYLLVDAVRRALWERGIREVELSWVLEDNSGTIKIMDSIGSTAYKRYRLYEKSL